MSQKDIKMITIDSIKEKIRDLLIEKDGDVQPHELKFIIEEAKQIGIDDKQIAKLVPEIDRSINWEYIRKQKEEEKERLKKFEEETKKKEEEIKSAPEFIDALLQYCLADGIVEATELQIIFAKAEFFKQDLNALSRKIKSTLDVNKYKPYPNPDLKSPTLKDTLLSTNWYSPQQYTIITTPPPPPPKPFPWKILTVIVLLFLLIGGVIGFAVYDYNTKTRESEIKLAAEKTKQDSIAFFREQTLIEQKTFTDSIAYAREKEERKIAEESKIKQQQFEPTSNPMGTIQGVFPQASQRLLSHSDLSGLSKRELKIMRNEIFARHGYIFKTDDMKYYFNKQNWYRPLRSDATAFLTEIERKNIELIKKYD